MSVHVIERLQAVPQPLDTVFEFVRRDLERVFDIRHRAVSRLLAPVPLAASA